MLKILHISDPHADSETMTRLGNLAHICSDCDVIACTGDCASLRTPQVPADWNEWPQELKLAVPGNHDGPRTFELLDRWQAGTHWAWCSRSVLFLGLDNFCSSANTKLLDQIDVAPYDAVVALCHYRLQEPLVTELAARSTAKPLLILHGHEHPTGFGGTEWAVSDLANKARCFRSNVFSSHSARRGTGQLIEWDGESFSCTAVRGPSQLGTIVEHRTFGRGLLVDLQRNGNDPRDLVVTVNFVSIGETKIYTCRDQLFVLT
jgi:hypothetical protein